MKAISAVCATGATVPAIASGRVRQRHREGENDPEFQIYLTKLKDLVPFMAKDRKMSKLEVIKNVIEYIGELQHTLALADATSDASSPVGQRQPLGVHLAASNSQTTSCTNITSTITNRNPSVATETLSSAAEINEDTLPSC